MKDIGPEIYRALHLGDARSPGAVRRGVNPSSPIAALLASLVVSAHGDGTQARVQTLGAPLLATVEALGARWRKAIENADTVALGAMLADHADVGLAACRTPDGRTALMVAARADDLALLTALVEAGADIEARADAGGTALLAAAAKGCSDSVGGLLGHGADPASVDEHGCSALMWAVRNAHEDVVSQLLQIGGSALDLQDASGKAALDHAMAGEHVSIAAQLRRAGAQRRAVNRRAPGPSCGPDS